MTDTRTMDRICTAHHHRDYAALPYDPARGGVQYDYSQPEIPLPLRPVQTVPGGGFNQWQIEDAVRRAIKGTPARSAGPPLSMVEAHEAQMFERTLQTAEQREEAARQGYQRLLNLEAATALVASITQDEIEAFLREVEACQQD